MLSIFLLACAFLDDWNPNARRQLFSRRWKVNVLIFHDEAKNASANSASKAVKRLALRTDVKGGRFFLMKRAERLEVCAGSFQWKIRADDFDDVVRGRDLFNCFGRNHRFDFSLVC